MKPIKIPYPMPDFQIQNLDGEIVLLHPVQNTILHINPTGALIWQLCNGVRSVTEIVIILSEAYPEARNQIAVDVPKIIYELAAHGALFKE